MHLSCKCARKVAPEGQLRLQLAPFLRTSLRLLFIFAPEGQLRLQLAPFLRTSLRLLFICVTFVYLFIDL